VVHVAKKEDDFGRLMDAVKVNYKRGKVHVSTVDARAGIMRSIIFYSLGK
jgi:hypothetical protein